jgi:hypothetical protein
MHETVYAAMTHHGSNPLRLVLARFPGSEAAIRDLFEADEQFRELCADYGDCLMALRRLREQGPGRDDRIEQYAELRACLEQELLDRVAESTRG